MGIGEVWVAQGIGEVWVVKAGCMAQCIWGGEGGKGQWGGEMAPFLSTCPMLGLRVWRISKMHLKVHSCAKYTSEEAQHRGPVSSQSCLACAGAGGVSLYTGTTCDDRALDQRVHLLHDWRCHPPLEDLGGASIEIAPIMFACITAYPMECEGACNIISIACSIWVGWHRELQKP